MPSDEPRRTLALGVGSARDVLIATAIAGAAGYGITVAAGAILGPQDYLPFAAFWSVLYLVVGALAGVQHETTRATRPSSSHAASGTLARSIFLVTGAASVALLAGSAPWWVPRVFAAHGGALFWPTVVGAVGYLAICVATGVLAGLASWRLIAAVTVADATLRAIAVGTALLATDDVVALAWAVALPFGAVGVIAAFAVGRLAQGRYVIADGLRTLTWNSSRTVASGAAMGALITGLPAILAATAKPSDADFVASIVYVSNLVRSPLIVLTMAFQGLLVQRLRDSPSADHMVARLGAAIAAAVAVVTLAVALVGPWALSFVAGGEYKLGAGHMAVLVASAAPTAALFVTGAALLARARHGAYVWGWGVAAVLAVGALLLPVPLWSGVTMAVLVAPTVGLAVHLAAWLRVRNA